MVEMEPFPVPTLISLSAPGGGEGNASGELCLDSPPISRSGKDADGQPNPSGIRRTAGNIIEASAWPAVSEAMSARLARNWWVIALRGAFAILFGIAALLLPAVTLAALVLIWWMAANALFFGVALLVLVFRLRKRRHDLAALQGA